MSSPNQPVYPEWMKKGKISSSQLRAIYTTLMTREHARMDLRKASRDVLVPARFDQEVPRKRSSIQKVASKLTGGGNHRSAADQDLSDQQRFYSVRAASQPATQNQNRYCDIEPYDRNRVLVGSLSRDEGRYLNASWVREIEGQAWWIAAQAPLFNTTHAFLSLLTSLQPDELRPRLIVQLTPIVENGLRKADQYIPETPASQPLQFFPEPNSEDLPHIEVRLISEEAVSEAGCAVRTVEVKLMPSAKFPKGESFEIKHVDYTGWPDHSVPKDPNELVALAQVVSSINQTYRFDQSSSSSSSTSSTAASYPPILCHCSAGVGRTGTFIAISSLLRAAGRLPPSPTTSKHLNSMFYLLSEAPLAPLSSAGIGDDPIAREVDGLREQRTTMVQRSEQLAIVYQIMINTLATGQ